MVTFLVVLAVAPLIILTTCFAIEVLAGLRPIRGNGRADEQRHSAVVIVPAHDEESILADTLENLKRASNGAATLLVVADNCSDRTAATARGAGAEVIERSDPDRRGKGYALDYARQHLRPSPPEVVLVIDADCAIDERSVRQLISVAAVCGAPAQAIYLQSRVPEASPAVQLSTFAFFVRNAIRQRGLQRLAGRVHLVGTGMAFPWPLFERLDLASGNIVEDLQMGLELADAGHPPVHVEDATVWSDPASQRSTLHQRRRWEGGYLQTARRWLPAMLIRSGRQHDPRLFWAALSLAIPPLALLVLLDLAALVLAGLASWSGVAGSLPALLLAAALGAAAFGLVLTWAAGGSRFVSLLGLIQAPLYLAWKLPLYVALARRGAPKDWNRTERQRL